MQKAPTRGKRRRSAVAETMGQDEDALQQRLNAIS
jgi:hypothetical protein